MSNYESKVGSGRRKLIWAATAICALLTRNAHAEDHWIRLKTPHFEMYTTGSEKQGMAALNVFEQVRYFFTENNKLNADQSAPVRIIAFRSEKEFRPYRLNEGGFAYYVQSRKVDYIVMQDISPEHYPAVMHEYTHLILQHSGLKLPVWLNEGLADLYSSLEPRGNQAMVGRAAPGRVELLTSQRWMDLSVMLESGKDFAYYNERDKMSIFYAQSWALTHMLAMSEEYGPQFPKFVTEVASGRPTAESIQLIYGKTLSQVTTELHAYVSRSSLGAAVYNVNLAKQDLEPYLSEPSGFAMDLVLTDLLAAQKRTQAEAAERLMRLAAEHPESAEVQESLGYLAWSEDDKSKALECFRLATEKGSKNSEMLIHYAQLLYQSAAPADKIAQVLQKVVEIKPDNQEAWFNLGNMATRARDYGAALTALSHVKTVTTERAYALFSTRAFCLMQLRSLKLARESAEQAQKYARTPEEQSQGLALLRHLDSLERGGR